MALERTPHRACSSWIRFQHEQPSSLIVLAVEWRLAIFGDSGVGSTRDTRPDLYLGTTSSAGDH
jgi:hypothetical protein